MYNLGTKTDFLGLLALTLVPIFLLGCASILGIEDLPETPSDAGVADDGHEGRHFALRGEAVGLLKPLSLQLTHDDGNETLSVTGDGVFTFSTRIADGGSYAVSFASEQSCTIAGGSGVVA